MSSPEFAPNPYAAPDMGYAPPRMTPPGTRPGWYTFFCVMAIVLGSLGAANALMGTTGLIFQQSFQQGMQGPPPPGMSQEFIDLQQKMNDEVIGVTKRYFVFLLIIQILLAAVAVGLLIGGIRALSMSRSGAKMLSVMFVVTSIFELGRLVVTIFHQLEVGEVMKKHFGPLMEKMPNQGGGAPPGFANMMSTIVAASVGFGICFTVVWVIVKLVLYLGGWFYLNKPHVQAILKD